MPSGPGTSWIYLGRQQHGWFVNGTSPDSDDESADPRYHSGGLFDPANIGARVDYAARSVIGHLNRKDRQHPAAVFDSKTLVKLRNAIVATDQASGLSRDAFRQKFFDPYTDEDAIDRWRSVAQDIAAARTPAALSEAGSKLANAMQQVGLYRWRRYLSDLNDRVATIASEGAQGQKPVFSPIVTERLISGKVSQGLANPIAISSQHTSQLSNSRPPSSAI